MRKIFSDTSPLKVVDTIRAQVDLLDRVGGEVESILVESKEGVYVGCLVYKEVYKPVVTEQITCVYAETSDELMTRINERLLGFSKCGYKYVNHTINQMGSQFYATIVYKGVNMDLEYLED